MTGLKVIALFAALFIVTTGLGIMGSLEPTKAEVVLQGKKGKGKGPKTCKPNKNRICITIIPDPPPLGFVGLPYSLEIHADGGTPPYTWNFFNCVRTYADEDTGEVKQEACGPNNLPDGLSFVLTEEGVGVLTGTNREIVLLAIGRE